jgi:hypothetical protein
MMENVGYNPDYDFLYDPQQDPSYGFCECGNEIYARGERLCYDCREATQALVRRLIRKNA